MAASTSKTAAEIGIGGGGGSGGRPHFFKIILDDSVRDGKLFIPTKFVKKYGGGLQDSAVLRDPSGKEWTVELTESDGDVWLQNGFREFAQFYSLSHGHLVVFELVDRRISCFNVVIFDPTATEIEYPSTPPPPQAQPQPSAWKEATPARSPVREGVTSSGSDESESSDDDGGSDVEILDVTPFLSGKPRGSSGDEDLVSNCSSDKKVSVGRTTAAMGLDAGECQWKKKKRISIPPLKFDPSPPAKIVSDQKRGGGGGRNNGANKLRGLSSREKSAAIDRAKAAFTSTNPHFMLAINPSYVYPGTTVAIPMSFCKEHFKARSGEAILSREYDGGRRWKVMYTVNGGRGNPESTPTKRLTTTTSASFRCGWKDFAGANQLRVGDVCAFELVKSSADDVILTFRVTVFRKERKNLR